MVDTINVSDLTIAGRIDAPDPKNGQIAIQKNLSFAQAASYTLDFGVLNQSATIGVIRTLFCDNSNNPSEISVQVMGTGQKFTVPGNAEGYFPITSRINSAIILESEGGAEKNVVVIFYNYDIPPAVWYKYGAINKDIPIKAQGANPAGSVIAGSEYPNPDLIAAVDPDGKVRYVTVDGNGALRIANLDVTIGAVFGPDAVGGAPTHPGLLMAVLDSAGNVKNLALNADGELLAHDSKVIDAVNALKAAVISGATAPTSSTITSVASAVANTPILAANPDRKGVCVFNNSAAVLRLALGDVDATVIYSVAVQPGDTYLLGNGDYTGIIRGSWVAANGNAFVTEFE